MNNKFAIGFILYKPTDKIINRIVEFSNSGFKIFIYDNDINSSYGNLFNGLNIKYFTTNKNVGLSSALHYLCYNAKNSGFSSLLYFDQDTFFNKRTLLFINNYLEALLNTKDVTLSSVVCTTFRDLPLKYRNWNNINNISFNNQVLHSVYFTINSGSLYMLDKFLNYNWFDNDFFVDGVDYAFCINSKKNKLQILEIYDVPGLDHDSEQGNVYIKIFGKSISGRSYNIKRNLDFISSHIKLIFKSFSLFSPKATFFLIKSTLYYIILQLIFKVIK
jgi:rhamnosyltransferase